MREEKPGRLYQPDQMAPLVRATEPHLLAAGHRLVGRETREDREHRGEVRIRPAHPAIYAPQPPVL
jgi:hypothetical protein